jgi:hypothetical protein
MHANAINPILDGTEFSTSVAWLEKLGWAKGPDRGAPPHSGGGCVEQRLELTWRPSDMPRNAREMRVRNPGGHVLRISEAVPESGTGRDGGRD